MREWTGKSHRLRLEKEIERLREIVNLGIDLLERSGNRPAASRLRRALSGK